MDGDWEIRSEAELAATPEQVWRALATGAGLNAWFSGAIELQPGPGGKLRSTIGAYSDELSVTAWEPGRRVTYRSSQDADNRFYALEWLVEGRAGGTLLRCVASGFIPGDDWEAEFDSLRDGGAMYFSSLVEYATFFSGQTALVVDAFSPPQADWTRAWPALTTGLGLDGSVAAGDRVRLTPAGFAPIEGEVFITAKHVLAVRTDHGLYRFVKAGPVGLASHRLFATDGDPQQAAQEWQAWLTQVFA
jgi:uncharacterized protein YndB with AHSA1/START domain